MTETKNITTSEKLVEVIISAMKEKIANDIVEIDFKSIPNAIADYFVICTGNTQPHIEAIAEEIQKQVKLQLSDMPKHKEGLENCEWVLMDYFSVIVHIFQKDARNYYELEKLWADASQKTY